MSHEVAKGGWMDDGFGSSANETCGHIELMELRKEGLKGEASAFLHICLCSCVCSGTQVSACIYMETRGQASVPSSGM